MAADNVHETVRLPQVFGVKYLGKREARGLWGIKYTRGPVDDMVNTAKALKPGTALPFLQFKVGIEGVTVSEMQANTNKDFESGFYPVDIISYGVQVKEQNQNIFRHNSLQVYSIEGPSVHQSILHDRGTGPQHHIGITGLGQSESVRVLRLRLRQSTQCQEIDHCPGYSLPGIQ